MNHLRSPASSDAALQRCIKFDEICSISTCLSLQSSLFKTVQESWLERCLMLVFCWLFLTIETHWSRDLRTSLLYMILSILMKLQHLYSKNMKSLLTFSQSHELWESWKSHAKRLIIFIRFRIQTDNIDWISSWQTQWQASQQLTTMFDWMKVRPAYFSWWKCSQWVNIKSKIWMNIQRLTLLCEKIIQEILLLKHIICNQSCWLYCCWCISEII